MLETNQRTFWRLEIASYSLKFAFICGGIFSDKARIRPTVFRPAGTLQIAPVQTHLRAFGGFEPDPSLPEVGAR
jgi:hypothetical protein